METAETYQLLDFKSKFSALESTARRRSNCHSTFDKEPSFLLINQQLTLEELNYPLCHDDEIYICDFKILGSCHGLILFNVNKHIYLLNPATRFCIKVLELDELTWVCKIRAGLCFDSFTNVYKAVFLMKYTERVYADEFVIIASLEDKQWRELEFPYDIYSVSEGITLHGRLHYKINIENSNNDELWVRLASFNKVIYFDPNSKKFHVFPISEPICNLKENIIVGLGVLYKCFCMARLLDDKGNVEILIMKEYRVKKSWTSLFFIKNILDINFWEQFAVPFFMAETEEIALVRYYYDESLVVYNLKNENTIEILDVCGLVVNYVESLISPKKYYWSEKRHNQYGIL